MISFAALAEPTRQSIIELLAARGRMSASEISRHFSSTASAISQHLKVLREARLIKMERRAQKRIYELNPQPMAELAQWATDMGGRLDKLDAVLKANK